jgi:hypothetical protein
MEKIILYAIVITILFFILKYVESRYLDKEERGFKYLLRDATIVFISSLSILFLTTNYDSYVQDFLSVLMGKGNTMKASEKAVIFTGEPEF